MIKKIQIGFFCILLSIVSSYGQTNPYYNTKQINTRPLASNTFDVTGVIAEGNPFYQIYPAYTTFITDGYVLENIPASKHIQGLPIGFKFPYAGQEFDIYALNVKGYIVLGKSSEGGMTIYADTLIETAVDTIFTTQNKYLISGLYPGKNLDLQGQVIVNIYKGGFEGERTLYISLLSINSIGQNQMIIATNFELKQTGEININPYVQYLPGNINSPTIKTYASILQRYGMDFTNYIYTTSNKTDAWFHALQSYNNTDYKYGILSDTIMPSSVNQKLYTINYYPKFSNFDCPSPIRWDPNLHSYRDSAYAVNDYEILQDDTLSTTDRIWWFSDMRDSLRFDVYLGTDEISMQLYKTGIKPDTLNINFISEIFGMVNLPLDSLAGGQQYHMKIHTINLSGDTVVCKGYSFYTEEKEQIKNYCRSEEPLFSGIEGSFSFVNLDLNTLHFHPDSTEILGVLNYKTLVPDTGSWTTNIQQGQSYLLELSTSSYLDIPAYYYVASVYLDYNNDGDFEDAGEFYYTFGIETHHYQEITINVPLNAVPGKTRLRVVLQGYDASITNYPGPCEKKANFSDFIVTVIQAPGCNLSYSDSIVPASCATYNNAAIGIIPEGGIAPYHIQWNTGNAKDTLFTLSDLVSPARHRATITDALGCNIRTGMLQITQPLPLQIDTFFQSSPQFIVFSGGTKKYRAVITGDKTETRYAVNDTIFLTDLFPSGNYTIQVTDSNDCNMQEYTINKNILDVDNRNYRSRFVLFPNPATNYIQISGIDTDAKIIIYTIDGKKVFEGNAANQQQIALPDLISGLYFVNIEEMERKTISKLIIE